MNDDEATTVFDQGVTITMRGVADSVGLPYTVNPVEIVDREVLIELREGPAGVAGTEGAAAWPWAWQGDIADVAALSALGLTTADARKAWRVVSENAIYYWTGTEFIAFDDAFRQPGRRGPVNVLTGVGLAGAVGSAASARILGTAPNQQLEITFPRGEQGAPGAPGTAGRIADASDVLVTEENPLGQGYVLGFDSATAKFRPIPSPRLRGPWTIGNNQFLSAQNLKEDSKVLAAITIPAQPTPWRPWVEGAVGLSSAAPTRCDATVRIGAPDGEVVARGWGHWETRSGHVLISPGFDFPVEPGAQTGIVPANQTATLYVVATRAAGSGTYSVYGNFSHLQVRALPV
ncbi:hypothetical protein [Nocardia alba]|uniref:Minor tail protein n=1 Tax=Nocardia alba TaxID=225051 RepID=A0A4V2PCA9_9NOCA|nr:hypothetical protein [Nocardia alba]TCK00526.1 hypothetical protein DFR71_1528 [Nocardia alba]